MLRGSAVKLTILTAAGGGGGGVVGVAAGVGGGGAGAGAFFLHPAIDRSSEAENTAAHSVLLFSFIGFTLPSSTIFSLALSPIQAGDYFLAW
jgi:hypothetical protein